MHLWTAPDCVKFGERTAQLERQTSGRAQDKTTARSAGSREQIRFRPGDLYGTSVILRSGSPC